MTETPFVAVESPAQHFYADLFLVASGDTAWIFVEDYDYTLGSGTIACARITDHGGAGEFRTCLKTPYHLSYPHVFSHDGESYMIPESAANDSIELWKAIEFPYRWGLERVMLRAPAAKVCRRQVPVRPTPRRACLCGLLGVWPSIVDTES